MAAHQTFSAIALFLLILLCYLYTAVKAGPIYLKSDHNLNQATDLNSTENFQTTSANCTPEEFSLHDVSFLENKDILLSSKRIRVSYSDYTKEGDKILICPKFLSVSSKETTLNCTAKFEYDSNEYEILPNGSALVDGEITPREDYALQGKKLLTCVPEEYSYENDEDSLSSDDNASQVSIYVGKIGSGISIVALIIHLLTFCFLPTLRNLPGYNLTSLSVAFLLAYSFVLIGQIPQVLGLFCIISAVLQQNFFLAAFFWMNVLAFDVWRMLRLATDKLALGSQNTRKRQFIWYSLYAWGCPFLISAISVIIDNTDGVPDEIKPEYGKNDTCWITNNVAKTIFFAAPAFTLFLINGIFFFRSSWLISSNAMKSTNDQSKQTVKFNYVLYLRLGIMMGLTWLVGVIALISRDDTVWLIFDILNSLQGLFLFLLFTCTKKVMKNVREITSSTKGSKEKQNTLSTASANYSSKPSGD